MTFEQNLILLQLHLPNHSQMLCLLQVKRCSQGLHLKVEGQYKAAAAEPGSSVAARHITPHLSAYASTAVLPDFPVMYRNG